MSRRSGPFIWLAERPGIVMGAGCVSAIISFVVSYRTGHWHWFPRGGAVMALSGFIVSVREALLYSPTRPPEYRTSLSTPTSGDMVRRSWSGAPVSNPFLLSKWDPDLTSEELDKALDDWEYAESDVEEPELVRLGEEGRPMRDLSEFTDEDFSRIRLAAILGVIGTFVWAFGDLLGGP